MSALTEVVGEHHERRTATGTFGVYAYCICGEAVDGPHEETFADHLMGEVEHLVREHIAQELEALEDNPLLKGLVAINGGAQAMLEYALATVRGES